MAREVIASVRQSGDEALHCLTRRFDAVELDALSVAPAEFAQARRSLARGQIAALERALANVHAFHAAQLQILSSGTGLESIRRTISTPSRRICRHTLRTP